MQIEKTKKQLRMISQLFVLLGALDLIIFIGDTIMDKVSFKDLAEQSSIPNSSIMGVMVIAVILTLLQAFVKLYLGITGIKQTNGSLKGKIHITVAKIVRVLYFIALIAQMITFALSKTFDIVQLSTLLTGTLFTIYYVNYATDIYMKNH